MKLQLVFLSMALVFFSGAAIAEDRGFLADYSQLEFSKERGNLLVYINEEAFEAAKYFNSIMIDQPELFLDADSEYKGMKPNTMTTLAENLRAGIIEGMEGRYAIVDTPGEKVLYLRLAATNLYIKKAKRGLLSYTPVGAIAKAVKDSASEFLDKNTLVEMTIEAEVLSSTTGKVYGALLIKRGQRKDKDQKVKETPATWAELSHITSTLGARLACHLDNAQLPEDQQSNCLDIKL